MFFNNVDLSPYLKVNAVRGRGVVPSELTLIEVPGRHGAYFSNKRMPPRTLEVDYTITASTRQELREKIGELNAIFDVSEPVPIVFDDEPEYTYYGIPESTEEKTEFIRVHQGTITFVCPDPHKYGLEKEALFPSDVVSLDYGGTTPGDPVFELEVLQPVTFALIQNDDEEYIMAGHVVNLEEQEPVAKEQLIFWSEANTLTGWTTGTRVDGTISGSIQTDGYRFYPASYGTGTRWHGPAVKTSLPEPLEHFRVDAIVEFYNSAATAGRVEIYLLDDADDIIGKIALKDLAAHYAETYGEARAGDIDVNYHLINETGATPTTWANFYGLLRIGRYGNQWFAYIAKIDKSTGRRHARMYRSWIDTEGHFTSKKLAQVMVHFGQLKTYQPVPTYLEDIKVYKWNPTTDVQVPYIAYEGDVITFDHKEKNILINGEPRLDLKDFGARFFKLKPGENILTVYPDQSFKVTCRYRERFK